MSFRFLDLVPQLRERVLKHALVKGDMIQPYYNNGSIETVEADVQKQNYETSLLSVSKQINLEAANVLYGHNTFDFTQPRLALWFFRHIGDANLSKLRSVKFMLGSGDTHRSEVMEERLWQELFAWLKPRHRFQELQVSFQHWRPLKPHRPYGGVRSSSSNVRWNHLTGFRSVEPVEDNLWLQRYQMQMARERMVEILKTYRGLKEVWIRGGEWSSDFGAFLTTTEVRDLVRLMQQRVEVA
ncbi:MAG: hypothetical protein M1830_001425 [Pleopsidium flavum]|nr:MAG: hypothetical protein M1830_001425 [Pleopsidium flavum]